MLRRFLLFKFAPSNRDLALFAMRVIAAISILLKHGLEKVFDFQAMYVKMEAKHHYFNAVGMGPTLVMAAISDGILTVLLIFGLATRWCALICLMTLAGAWYILGFPYFTTDSATHGEMIVAYMAILIALVLAGGGKYSLDAWLDRER